MSGQPVDSQQMNVPRAIVRSWPLVAAIAVLAALPALMMLTRHGRVAVEAAFYLPDMVLQLPGPRPIELFTEAPIRERVTIEYESRNGPRSIEADLYLPASGDNHPGVVFSMGAPPLDLDEPRLVRVAEDIARSGVVILVPFSERLDDEKIVPEEIDALVAEFQYVQKLPRVDPEEVGFFGASVGGSLALVAAADPRIAGDVDLIVSFGGYFDALQTFGAIATHHIEYDGVDEEWEPRKHAERVMAHQLIDAVDSPRDRELLRSWFLDDEPVETEELTTLTPVGRSSYDFLTNEDPEAVESLIARLPRDAVARLDYLSPRTSIDRVEAEMIIIHDRADPFIPYTELRRMRDAIGDDDDVHFDEIRLFEHVEPRLAQRPDVIVFDTTRVLYRLYQLLLRWS